MPRKAKTFWFAICFSLLAGAGITNARITKPVIRSPRDVPTTGCYIVVLKETTTLEELQQILSRVKEVSVDRKVYAVVKNVQKAFTVKLSAEVLEEIRTLDQVKYIEEEDLVEGAALPWHLDRLDQTYLPLDYLYTSVGDGEGVDIYILDTGINFDHEEFEYRAKYAGYDPVDQYLQGTNSFQRMSGRDCHGHGTHVASLVGGKTFGVAKKASLYSVRVLRCENSAPLSTVLDGLDFVSSIIPKRGRNAIISISLSGSFHHSINDAIETLYRQGIPVVVAAGNNHIDACTISPASSVHAITVGATTRDDSLYEHSNYGSCVDIFAPGESLWGADYNCRDRVNNRTGTSQAVGVVSGVAAVYLSHSPFLTPDQLKQKVIDQSLEGVINLDAVPGNFRTATLNRLLNIGCGGRLEASDDPKQLRSRNFPMNYPNNIKCTWTIISQGGAKAKISFSYLKLEENYDSLTVCDGCPCSAESELARLSGNYEHVDCGYVSSSGTLTLVMETDGSATSPGFSATYVNYDAMDDEGAVADCKLQLNSITAPSVIQLDVKSAGFDVGNRFVMKKDWKEFFAGRMPGLNVAILDETSGQTLYTGNFDTHLFAQEAKDFATTIENTPSGRIVLVSVSGRASQSLSDRAKRAIRTLGSLKIDELGYGDSWALIGIKGSVPGTAIEGLDADSCVELSMQYQLQQRRKYGIQIVAKSAGTSFGNLAEIIIEGEVVEIDYSRGLNVVVLDESNGNILHSRVYDTHTDYAANTLPADAFASFIDSLPGGRVVAIAMKDEAVSALTESAKDACKSIGSTLIEQVELGGSWAIIGTKGAPSGSAAEAGSNSGAVQSTFWLPLDSSTIPNSCSISISSSGLQKGVNTDININDIHLARRYRGISVAVVKEEMCDFEKVETFDTYSSARRANDLAGLIHTVPVGRIVIAVVWDEASRELTEKAKLALESIGSALIRNVGFREAWGIIGRKGAAPGSVPEVQHANSTALRAVQQLIASDGLDIIAKSAGNSHGNYWNVLVDGTVIQLPDAENDRGLNVIIIDENSGTVITHESFDTHASSDHSEAFANDVNALPNGRIVVIAMKDAAANSLTDSAIQACEDIGSSLIRQIEHRGSWVIIGQKGAPKGTVAEAGSNTEAVQANAWLPRDRSVYSCNIAVVSAGLNKGLHANITVNGQKTLDGEVFRRGITIAIIDESTCTLEKAQTFDTHNSIAESDQLAALIQATPRGKIIAATIWDSGTDHLTENAKLALSSIGSVSIRAVNRREAWAIIGRKGAPPGSVPEAHHPSNIALQSWVKIPAETCDKTIYPLNCRTTSFTAENSPILA